MPRITIKVTPEARLVSKAAEDLTAEVPQIGANRLWGKANNVKRRMQKYPPPRPKQKYVRTYRLMYSWRVLKQGETGYRIEADPVDKRGVHYGAYVVGDSQGQYQAWMHVGRWQVFRDVVEEEMSNLPAEVEQYVKVAMKRKGL